MTRRNNVTAVIAVLTLLGGLTVAAAGPIIRPFSWLANVTGWDDGATEVSGPIVWQVTGTTSDTRGWCAFNSDTVTISAYSFAILHFYQDSTSGDDRFNFRDAPDAEPRTMGKVALYAALVDANSRVIGQDTGYIGWHGDTLWNPVNWPPPQVGSELVISWCDVMNSSANYGSALGKGPTNPPYMEFFK